MSSVSPKKTQIGVRTKRLVTLIFALPHPLKHLIQNNLQKSPLFCQCLQKKRRFTSKMNVIPTNQKPSFPRDPGSP